MNKIIVIVFAAILLIGGGLFLGYIGANDTEIKMRSTTESQQLSNKADFDKQFKTIAQAAQVPEQFMKNAKESFKEIYIPIMDINMWLL